MIVLSLLSRERSTNTADHWLKLAPQPHEASREQWDADEGSADDNDDGDGSAQELHGAFSVGLG